MTSQAKTGLSILAVATVHSATTAFVPLENRARMDSFISRTNRRRPAGPRRGYSRNDVDDNNNNDLFINPEPVDPASSSSSAQFHPMFFAHENPLDEMFAVVIKHVNKTWREMRATTADFDKVMEVAKEQVGETMTEVDKTVHDGFRNHYFSLNPLLKSE